MNQANWTRLKGVFQEALELPAAERGAFLERVCGSDIALRDQVQSLLAAYEDASDDSPTLESTHNRSVLLSEKPGDRIGPYRVLELIGEGGFGLVYLAQQEHPVRRRVAVKVIKLGMDTRQVVARFEAERQALAVMDHPAIARVFDGGTTSAGRPYFVMERVCGVPLTRYCDEKRLGIRDRLELFIRVCDAVQHAHQKGVIHRDLKPNNILAGPLDAGHTVKVIDFGIAKAVQPLIDRSFMTEQRQLLGTPQYMSPEQAAGALDVDTRTDVYSLGAVLYELLTGSTPFEGDRLRRLDHAEVQRIIREEDPPRPSTRIEEGTKARRYKSTKSDDSAAVSLRALAPPYLGASAVRGELDWIVMKALERDRNRRYDSASALSEDLRRYLNHEPVQAGPPSSTYRARKWIQRHKTAFSIALVTGLAVMVGAAGLFVGLRRAQRAEASESQQRKKAEESERVAIAQAARSREVARFLEEMLRAIDPATAHGRDTSVLQDVMKATAARLDKELADQPEVRAELHDVLGNLYQRLGNPDAAESHLGSALELYQRTGGGQSSEAASVIHTRGLVRQDKSDFDGAEAFFQQALAMRQSSLGPEHEDVAASLRALGELATMRERWSDAERFLDESLAMQGRQSPQPNATMAETWVTLAYVWSIQSRNEEAVELLQRALKVQEATVGRMSLSSARTLGILGGILNSQGRYSDAEPYLREQGEILEKHLPRDHPDRGAAMNNLALNLHMLGRLDEAESLFKAALRIEKSIAGPDSLRSASTNFNLGCLYQEKGEWVNAEHSFRSALKGRQAQIGVDQPTTLAVMGRLSQVLELQLKLDDAERVARETVDLARTLRPASPEALAEALFRLGCLLTERSWDDHAAPKRDAARQRAVEAAALLTEALAIRRSMSTDVPFHVAACRASLATAVAARCVASATQPAEESPTECFSSAEHELLAARTELESKTESIRREKQSGLLQASTIWLVRLYEVWSEVDPTANKSAELDHWRAAFANLSKTDESSTAASQP